jgi:hypothetical protein
VFAVWVISAAGKEVRGNRVIADVRKGCHEKAKRGAHFAREPVVPQVIVHRAHITDAKRVLRFCLLNYLSKHAFYISPAENELAPVRSRHYMIGRDDLYPALCSSVPTLLAALHDEPEVW